MLVLAVRDIPVCGCQRAKATLCCSTYVRNVHLHNQVRCVNCIAIAYLFFTFYDFYFNFLPYVMGRHNLLLYIKLWTLLGLEKLNSGDF